jgi:hypothetical protein
MASLTTPVSVFGDAEAAAGLLVPALVAGICIWAAMKLAGNMRNAIAFTIVRPVFIGIPSLVSSFANCLAQSVTRRSHVLRD